MRRNMAKEYHMISSEMNGESPGKNRFVPKIFAPRLSRSEKSLCILPSVNSVSLSSYANSIQGGLRHLNF